MAENYTDGLIFTKNLDEKGTPFTPKLVEVAKVSENGKVQCKQNIYKKNGVRIISPDGLRRVNKVEQLLSSTNAYFIYEDRGEVLFSDDLIGQVVAFEYYGTGNPNIGDCRVFTTVDNKGNITETLGDIIREGRDIIESLRILGNGAIIFNKLEEVVANAEVLNSALGIKITVGQQVSERLEADINTGKALDTTLKATINTGNSTNTTLNNTIASANATKTEVVNTINTTVTNANNSVNATISKANTANTTLNATINKANESNTTLNATITHGEQVLGELNTQVTELETSDNKVFQINPTDWVLNASTNRYEKIITHGMGKTSLIFEYQTVKNGKKCSYFMDYEIQDENSIKFITESADTVYVNISARYSTNLRFEESQIEVDKMVDGSNKVVMTRAERDLIQSHSSQLEQITTTLEDTKTKTDDWNSFKTNGGTINGDLDLVKNDITTHLGYSSFAPVSSSWSVKGGVIETPIGLNLAVQPGQWSALVPFISNDISLGRNDYRFKDLWLGEFLKSPNGYTKLPNGLILQWGTITMEQGFQYATFPLTFPNKALFCGATVIFNVTLNNNGHVNTSFANAIPADASKAQITLHQLSESNNTFRVTWIAIGY